MGIGIFKKKNDKIDFLKFWIKEKGEGTTDGFVKAMLSRELNSDGDG